MSVYIVLLRAVNVGGTGKLPMADLKAMCIDAGFTTVHTYIASGNVLLESNISESKIKTILESRLKEYAGKEVGVIVRSLSEMKDVLVSNPYSDKPGNRTVAIFLDKSPPPNSLDDVKGILHEELTLGEREIYVHYGDGMGTSKLLIPAGKTGTARNMNTIAKLVELAGKMSQT